MGYIIVIEGTDGSGKKTQTELLYSRLKEKGLNVIKQSFPNYDSPSAAPVKMYLGGELGSNANCLNPRQASILYAADRLLTVKKLLNQHNNYDVIIFDRYTTSNMLHQAGKIQNYSEMNRFLKWLDNLEFKDLELPRPDKVFFLDMPVEVSKNLAQKRGELKTGEAKDIHEQDREHLINAYRAGKYVAKKFNWEVISCLDEAVNLKTPKQINDEIMERLPKLRKFK
jgi:dTMP kinase